MAVRPQPIREERKVVRDTNRIVHPVNDERGRRITVQPIVRAPRTKTIIDVTINNTVIINNIVNVYNRTELTVDRDYWHEDGGTRYCHRYDRWGSHWYGFYLRDSFYWVRHHEGRWWWHDEARSRWVYYSDSQWWYQDPVRVEVVYVYEDDGYYQYGDSVGGAVLEPEQGAVTEKQKSYYSKDGRRVVQIFGDDFDAFLYDLSEPAAFAPKWLGSGVMEVRYKFDPQDALVQILTLTDDGGFNVFDADGNLQDGRTPPSPTLSDPFGKKEPEAVPSGSAPDETTASPERLAPPTAKEGKQGAEPPAPVPAAAPEKGFFAGLYEWFAGVWKAIVG